MKKRIIYYKSYSDDFIESKNQFYKIPENYKWCRTNWLYRILSWVIYKIATIFCFFYCKFIKRVKIENNKILKKYKKSGYFLFGNHTQPMLDAFIPTYISSGKRVYIVVSSANFGIPILGRILPLLGALPVLRTTKGLIELKKAIEFRIKEKNSIVIYPEAHVWEYYTKIRPFSEASFRFPVETNAPTFCTTMTYQKSKNRKKPNITVFVDGPFFPDSNLTEKEQKKQLRDSVYNCMVERSKNSTYEYIHYEEEKGI